MGLEEIAEGAQEFADVSRQFAEVGQQVADVATVASEAVETTRWLVRLAVLAGIGLGVLLVVKVLARRRDPAGQPEHE